MDCIFCKIANKQIPSNIVFEDDNIIAFEDVKPQAPIHILIIPKQHIEKFQDISFKDEDLLEKDKELLTGSTLIMKMMGVIPNLALTKGIDLSGYRVVINNGKDAGQEVSHLHIHLLGGRQMQWPPG